MPDNNQRSRSSGVDQEPELITRFSIALMAFTLMGMGVGTALPAQFGALTLGTGIIGLVSFGVFEVTARRRHRETVDSLRKKYEARLSRQLRGTINGAVDQQQEELAGV